MFLDLIRNVALLAILAIGLQMLARRLAGWSLTYQLAAGLLFGGVAVLGMMTPIHLAAGVIYDGRSLVLSLAGLFGGPLTATVAAVGALVYRLSLGGAGTIAGVGTIIEATALGVVLHYLRRRDERWVSLPRLWLFGLVVHVIMLGLQWLIPGVDHLQIMKQVGPTVLVFFPLAFVLMASVFLESERAIRGKQELADAEEWLRLALEGANHGVWDWDVPARSIRYDERSVGMLGYTPEEAGPDPDWFESLMHPEDFPRVRKCLDDHFAGLTDHYQAEMRLRHKAGHWVWVLDRGRVIARDAAGRPLRACGTHLEITHAKELAEQLRQAQKMESVGQLAGGIAHDYNNMLSVILGHTELALARTAPGDPLCEELTAIRRAAERSALLTSQLLAFARRQTIAPRPLDLNQAVADLLDMLSRLIGEDIDLLWQPAPAVCSVTIDPSQLDQVLTNLAVNARDAIGGVGKLTIETAPVEIDASYGERHAEALPGAYVMLAVSDDGAGMDQATQERIFDPFFTTKPQGKGTGLGLATVYGIVKQNGGFINVYSEPGRGTTFRIYLPRTADPSVAPLPAAVTVPPSRTSATVLLVEDDPALLLLAHRMLENLGHRVLAAGSPGLALELARAHPGPIDLLLTDVVMPEMSGRELCQVLVRERPDLRCLYMSGYTANVIARQGVLEAGVDFLQKPFTVQELGAKLHEALANDGA